jgi:Skp family chaperone for outer membrane proteins
MEHNNYLQDILKEEKTDEFKQLAESLIKEVSKLQEELYQHSNKLPEELKSSILSLS